MKQLLVVTAALAYACSSSSSDKLEVTSTMTITAGSGSGVSPLEVLVGQQVMFTVTFVAPSVGHDPEGNCPTTVYGELVADKVAMGSNAGFFQSNVLAILPYWEAVLSVCNPTSGSSFVLRSDNQMGQAINGTCFELPPAALGINADGEPRIDTFMTTGRCSATLYDEANARLYGGDGLAMNVIAH